MDLHLTLERKDFLAADSARRLNNIFALQEGRGASQQRRRRRPGVLLLHIDGQPAKTTPARDLE